MCVVIVEDETGVWTFLQALLEDEGYSVLSFSHARPAMTLQRSGPLPHLFLLDIMLPDMDGISLAEQLRDEGFPTTPKIAMSASSHMLQTAKRSRLFDATLDKPFDIEKLLDYVERYAA